MTDKLKLVFVLHNHQPVGNFPEVFQTAFDKAYRPFLDLVENYPFIRFGLHLSGPLIEWLEHEEPGYLNKLTELKERGQLEMLGGAFYEAVLPMLSDRDRSFQLLLMNQYVENRFGEAPQGAWAAERVWEQSMVSDYQEGDILYTLLDDHHFKLAGMDAENLSGYFTAEDRGNTISVFPISEKLRYLIPFATPSEVIKFLSEEAKTKDVITYGDDGEKFGLWPHTYLNVYKKGWLIEFFSLVEANSDWLSFALPSEILESNPSKGRCFLPDCSYREMTEWALPVDSHIALKRFGNELEKLGLYSQALKYLKGASWRNFRARYPEAANMYAYQVEVSRRVNACLDISTENMSFHEALMHVAKGQCDCAYWHGVFGGLYLPHLRDAVYEQLIRAEQLVLPDSFTACEVRDFDLDGNDDVRLSNEHLAVYIKPSMGGMVYGLMFYAAAVNLANVLARHREEYHSRVSTAPLKASEEEEEDAQSIHTAMPAKEAGLANYLVYDWHERGQFQDHVIPHDTTVEQFRFNRYHDLGDFILEPYDKNIGENDEARLSRDGFVWFDGEKQPVQISKEFSIDENRLKVKYRVVNSSNLPVSIRLGVENNFGMSAGDSFTHQYCENGKEGGTFKLVASLAERSEIELRDNWRKFAVRLSWSVETDLWLFPISSVSQSESGFERIFQAAVVMPVWNICLEPEQEWTVEMKVEVSSC